ncbi:MAG TPA: DUF4097 family beta strand repeat-containing protein [Gemmatimonadales bacterium]|jgi:uncharacterized protein (UPF0333 family)|nr:DUF4097 family beta strand repeat-containing protein [Gemmatimonadales bacterium]
MIALSTLALVAALQGGQQSQDFRWTGTLAAGKTLSIRNINGSIDATPASGNQIEVTARKTAKRSDPASVEIKVEQTDDGVTICTIYPNQRGDGCDRHQRNSDDDDNRNDVSVAFTVRVPAAVLLSAHSVNGDVKASGLRSDVEIGTVNGDVSVATDGFAEASTVNGSVDVTMGRADWKGTASYRSVNGSVSVTMPASASADVRAGTVNGSIDTEFPLAVQGRFGPRSVRGTIGSGGRELDLQTVNGSIAIRKR